MPHLTNTLRCLCLSAVTLSLTAVTAQAQYGDAAPVPEKFGRGFATIQPEDSRKLLSVLAGEEFAGRGTGQEGYLKAARWYADRLAESGFEPAGTDGSWFQNVPFVRTAINAGTSVSVDGKVIENTTWGLAAYVGQAEVTAEVVLVNVANSREFKPAPEELRGRIVICQTAPRQRTPPILSQSGPACLIQISSRLRQEQISRTAGNASSTPGLRTNQPTATALARACGHADFFSDAPAENVITQVARAMTVRLAVERESIDVPNVIGWLQGSDPDLAHEHVGVGCHLDHLGKRGDAVYPGADDNGSGSTAVLQIARAITQNGARPKRSIMVIAFCAEERGLLGSRYYTENPTRPLKDMICMLNVDMIGRNEERPNEPASENEDTIHLVGSKRISMELHDLVIEANKHINFVFEYDEEGVYNRSDHANFARKGIPITFIFGGFNPHYHQTTDTLEGINFDKIANGARLNYLCAMMAAEHGPFARNE